MRGTAIVLSLLAECGGETRRTTKPDPVQPNAAEQDLARKIDGFVEGHLAFRPAFAIGLGS